MTETMYVRTRDAAWVAKNGGSYVNDDHLAALPVSAVDSFTFCGQPHIRFAFSTAPKDVLGQKVMAFPVALIPA